jgi:adenylate kinase family enzyme
LDELLLPGTKAKYLIETPEFRIHFENAQKSLKEGKAIDDQTIIGLIVEKIKTIEGGVYKKDTPVINPNNTNIGWLVDGFPRTLLQAQLFEKALTGFEIPVRNKRANTRSRDKRANSKLLLTTKEVRYLFSTQFDSHSHPS